MKPPRWYWAAGLLVLMLCSGSSVQAACQITGLVPEKNLRKHLCAIAKSAHGEGAPVDEVHRLILRVRPAVAESLRKRSAPGKLPPNVRVSLRYLMAMWMMEGRADYAEVELYDGQERLASIRGSVEIDLAGE